MSRFVRFFLENCPKCGSENTSFDMWNKECHCNLCGYDW